MDCNGCLYHARTHTQDKTSHKEIQELMATCEAELDSFS